MQQKQLDLTDKAVLSKLAKAYQVHPTKNMGQNFLISKSITGDIISASEIGPDDTVLEIGPGFGVLTFELIKHAGQVISVELDRRIVEYWQKNQEDGSLKNLKILNEDILDFYPAQNGLSSFDYKIVANLPYQISAPFLWKFLKEEKEKPSEMIIMLQKEVGERLVAPVGKLSLLGVLAQYYADCDLVTPVSRDLFWPAPKVDSVVVRLRLKQDLSQDIDETRLFKIIKMGFLHKRKKIKNNLKSILQSKEIEPDIFFNQSGIDPNSRPQDLTIDDWLQAYQILK